MDGLDFLNRHMRLGATYEFDKMIPGECPSCQRDTLIERGSPGVCIECSPLRRCHVLEKKGGGRFSLGSLMLVTVNETEIWTKIFEASVFPDAKVIPNKSAHDFFRRIMGMDGFEQIKPPYVVLAFAKGAAYATNIIVNYDADWLDVSLHPVPGYEVRSGHLALIRELLSNNVDFSEKDWDELIELNGLTNLTEKSRVRESELRERLSPKSLSLLPKANSPEHKFIKMVA